jgi:hypothetical protein
MLKRTIFIGLASLTLLGCGGNSATTNTTITNNANANVANTAVNSTANNANVANTADTANAANKANTNKSANTTAAKPASSSPKRVSFAAGKSEGNESLSLKAGESKQFVVGAKTGQIFMVDADSKDVEIAMVKGKDSAQMKEPGHYDSTLLADGDFVFQVKNTSKKDVKSSVKIIISHTGISKP